MFTIRMKWNAFRILATLAMAAIPGFANPILVNNFSFEALPVGGLNNAACGAGCAWSTNLAIPGWVSDPSTTGQFQPGTQAGNTTFFTALSDGITSAYTNLGTISQTVLPTVQLGTVYVLTVDIGARMDTTFASLNGTADLLINGNMIAAIGLAPVPGTWGTFTATYTGLAADVGQSITIELRANGRQGNFDNVQLLEEIPEPMSLLLIGPALLLLTALGRRRH
jgi:hypothetical protein